MIRKRFLLLFNAIWEILRFFLLFAVLIGLFRLIILANRQALFWLILLGSCQLVLPAGLLYLFFNPGQEDGLLKIIRMGKLLGLFAALLLFFLEPFSTKFSTLGLDWSPLRITPTFILLVIILIDLIFLFILLSYKGAEPKEKIEPERASSYQKPPSTDQGKGVPVADNLPDYEETEIPDEEP